jgi:ubiquinone biosynthesis protein
VSRESSRSDLRAGIKHVMSHFHHFAMSDIRVSSSLGELLTVVRRNHVKLPSNTFLLLKAMGMAQALGKGLDPDFDILQALEPDVKRILKKKNSPLAIINRLPLAALNFANFGIGFPPRLNRLMRSIERGDLQFRTDVSGLEGHLEHMEKLVNRLVIGFIISAVVVGLAILVLAIQLRR